MYVWTNEVCADDHLHVGLDSSWRGEVGGGIVGSWDREMW